MNCFYCLWLNRVNLESCGLSQTTTRPALQRCFPVDFSDHSSVRGGEPVEVQSATILQQNCNQRGPSVLAACSTG
jgi:hypothetical protein